jgi:hypothetical protein
MAVLTYPLMDPDEGKTLRTTPDTHLVFAEQLTIIPYTKYRIPASVGSTGEKTTGARSTSLR